MRFKRLRFILLFFSIDLLGSICFNLLASGIAFFLHAIPGTSTSTLFQRLYQLARFSKVCRVTRVYFLWFIAEKNFEHGASNEIAHPSHRLDAHVRNLCHQYGILCSLLDAPPVLLRNIFR